MKNRVLPPSPRFRFRLAKHKTIGAMDGSIMAAIMTAHMANTASQFAADQSDIGIVNCAAGLSMWMAPQYRRSQQPTAGAQTPAAVQACAPISLRGDAIKSESRLVGERSKESVPTGDIARDPVVVYLQAGCAGDRDGLARRYG